MTRQRHRLRQTLLDPARDTRTFAQRSHTQPLSGLLWCGPCDHLLRSSVLTGVLTSWCADLLGGCDHIRINAADVERYLLEEIAARTDTEHRPVETDAVLLATDRRLDTGGRRGAAGDGGHRRSRATTACGPAGASRPGRG